MFYELKSCLFAIFLHFCVISRKKKNGAASGGQGGGGYKNRSPGGGMFLGSRGGYPKKSQYERPSMVDSLRPSLSVRTHVDMMHSFLYKGLSSSCSIKVALKKELRLKGGTINWSGKNASPFSFFFSQVIGMGENASVCVLERKREREYLERAHPSAVHLSGQKRKTILIFPLILSWSSLRFFSFSF